MNIKEFFESGKNFSDYIYFKHEKGFKVFRYFLIILNVFIILFCLIFGISKLVSASALTTSTNSDLLSNSNYVNNLLSLIPDNQYCKKYVVFSNGDYSYYCFYGDLSYSNNKIIGTDINYIRYYRIQDGYNYSYKYDFGIDDLSLNVNNIVCSNLNFEKSSFSWSFDNWSNQKISTVCIIAFIPILLFANLWGCLRHDYI